MKRAEYVGVPVVVSRCPFLTARVLSAVHRCQILAIGRDGAASRYDKGRKLR